MDWAEQTTIIFDIEEHFYQRFIYLFQYKKNICGYM